MEEIRYGIYVPNYGPIQQTPLGQVNICKDFANSRQWVFVRAYSDEELSCEYRPVRRLIEDAANVEFQRVVVSDATQLLSDPIASLDLIKKMKTYGVTLQCVSCSELETELLEQLSWDTAALYVRKSTDKQDPMSIDAQIERITEAAKILKVRVLQEHTYIDDGITGTTMDRPALQKLLEHVETGRAEFERLLVFDTSRLSRDLIDALILLRQFKGSGIRVHYISDNIDSNDNSSVLLHTVKAIIDSGAIEKIKVFTSSGLQKRHNAGLWTGGNVFGYLQEPDGKGVKLVIYEPEAEIVREIFRLSAEGLGHQAIASHLNKAGTPPPAEWLKLKRRRGI